MPYTKVRSRSFTNDWSPFDFKKGKRVYSSMSLSFEGPAVFWGPNYCNCLFFFLSHFVFRIQIDIRISFMARFIIACVCGSHFYKKTYYVNKTSQCLLTSNASLWRLFSQGKEKKQKAEIIWYTRLSILAEKKSHLTGKIYCKERKCWWLKINVCLIRLHDIWEMEKKCFVSRFFDI